MSKIDLHELKKDCISCEREIIETLLSLSEKYPDIDINVEFDIHTSDSICGDGKQIFNILITPSIKKRLGYWIR